MKWIQRPVNKVQIIKQLAIDRNPLPLWSYLDQNSVLSSFIMHFQYIKHHKNYYAYNLVELCEKLSVSGVLIHGMVNSLSDFFLFKLVVYFASTTMFSIYTHKCVFNRL